MGSRARVDILETKNISLVPIGIQAPDHPAHNIATTPTTVCTYHDTYEVYSESKYRFTLKKN